MEEIMGPQMYWGGWTKEGGGQDTFPLPTSQNIPKQTVCPLFCYQGKFVYIHTLKYILCKLADKMEAKTLLNHMYWGGQMVPRHNFFRNVREKLIKADERN
jgi:hypothetical protein